MNVRWRRPAKRAGLREIQAGKFTLWRKIKQLRECEDFVQCRLQTVKDSPQPHSSFTLGLENRNIWFRPSFT